MQNRARVTPEFFKEWLNYAEHNDRIIYHYGKHLDEKVMKRITMEAYKEDKVLLFQKKIGENYEYWAVRIRVRG